MTHTTAEAALGCWGFLLGLPAPPGGRQGDRRLTAVLAGLGLEPKAAKTRIVHLREDKDAEGFDFLGFHHWWGARPAPQRLGPQPRCNRRRVRGSTA